MDLPTPLGFIQKNTEKLLSNYWVNSLSMQFRAQLEHGTSIAAT
jgi:hypothetical protein